MGSTPLSPVSRTDSPISHRDVTDGDVAAFHSGMLGCQASKNGQEDAESH